MRDIHERVVMLMLMATTKDEDEKLDQKIS